MSEIEWSRLKASEIKALAAAQRHRHRADRRHRAARAAPAEHGRLALRARGVASRRAHHGRRRSRRWWRRPSPTACPSITCRSAAPSRSTIATMSAVIRCVVQLGAARTASSASSCSTAMAATPTALQNMIGELTVEHQLPLATGTYWDIAPGRIAAISREAEGAAACLRGRDLDDAWR